MVNNRKEITYRITSAGKQRAASLTRNTAVQFGDGAQTASIKVKNRKTYEFVNANDPNQQDPGIELYEKECLYKKMRFAMFQRVCYHTHLLSSSIVHCFFGLNRRGIIFEVRTASLFL